MGHMLWVSDRGLPSSLIRVGEGFIKTLDSESQRVNRSQSEERGNSVLERPPEMVEYDKCRRLKSPDMVRA